MNFYTKVKKVERRSRIVKTFKVGDDVITDTQDMGWYIQFEGWESLYVGHDEPTLRQGQEVIIKIIPVMP